MPYGPLKYYQLHYIVKVRREQNGNILAKCDPLIKDHFGGKCIVSVKWTGADGFAEILQQDSKMSDMLKEVMLREGEMRVDPTHDQVRFHGKWIHEDALAINVTMFEITDRIAGHIKTRLGVLN